MVSELVREQDLPLMVDLYELSMAQAYWAEGMNETATFSLFFRELPPNRNFVLACGQRYLAELVTRLRFAGEHLERLARLDLFQPEFLQWLGESRFSGDIHALPEGTPVFPQEPLLEVEAPIAEAQLLESLAMNYVHLESVLASKAVRLVAAAGDKPVVDFGMRRMHGLDSAYRGVRAYRMAGLGGTSNVLAGQDFGLPVRGTMAHSYVQANEDEREAFRTYARLYPGTVLLVDTYDTHRAVRRIIDWLKAEPQTRISALRLDSGDLGEQAQWCRAALDKAGLSEIKVLASGGLDEYKIQALREQKAPIDGYGVGSANGTSKDAPCLELAYKLTEYAGTPRMKNSSGKTSYPGRKQVYRLSDAQGHYREDRITGREEASEGTPLLEPVVQQGKPVKANAPDLDRDAQASQEAVKRLPDELQRLEPADYPVVISDELKQLQADTLRSL